LTAGVPAVKAQPTQSARLTLESFLAGLKWSTGAELAGFFGARGRFVDASGKCWAGRDEIEKDATGLFAPFAKKNAMYVLENIANSSATTAVASVLWEFAAAAHEHSKSVMRMSVVLETAKQDWEIILVQITPVVDD
jgi:hypothetical protein